MVFPSQKETYDSNTPPDLSSRTSMNEARYSKRTAIQWDRESISNSSVHTTSPAGTSTGLFDSSEQNSGGVFSVSHRKSLHSLEKTTFRFRNQSQSSVDTIREAGSVRSSFENEDESSDDLLPEASAPGFPDPSEARAREARVLESRVARVASAKCSVEEVVALQKQVDRWLTEVTAADTVRVPSSSSSPSLTLPHSQSTALFLSSLLLKAILANHVAFSDEKGRLELELHK